MKYKAMFVPYAGKAGQWEQEFNTLDEANTALLTVSLYTLTLHELSLMTDYSNYGMVLVLDVDGDWIQVDDE